ESANEAGWTIPRHFDFRITGLLAELCLLARALLHGPVGLLAFDVRKHREVEAWRRRGRRPFERAPVPRIAGRVAKRLAPADADDELRDLQDYSDQNDGRAAGRDQQPRPPSCDIVVLHATGHSHQAQNVERHEGDVEADEPAPERGLAEAFVQPE